MDGTVFNALRTWVLTLVVLLLLAAASVWWQRNQRGEATCPGQSPGDFIGTDQSLAAGQQLARLDRLGRFDDAPIRSGCGAG